MLGCWRRRYAITAPCAECITCIAIVRDGRRGGGDGCRRAAAAYRGGAGNSVFVRPAASGVRVLCGRSGVYALSTTCPVCTVCTVTVWEGRRGGGGGWQRAAAVYQGCQAGLCVRWACIFGAARAARAVRCVRAGGHVCSLYGMYDDSVRGSARRRRWMAPVQQRFIEFVWRDLTLAGLSLQQFTHCVSGALCTRRQLRVQCI